MSPDRSISIANRHPRLKVPRKEVERVIKLLDGSAAKFLGGCPAGELSIVFLTDDALAQLHADFLNDPTPTDVITFEGDATMGVAGEVCVSADRAATYARRRHRDFTNELTLYLVHGWLHLAGYDDLEPAKKRRMRAAEGRALTEQLYIVDPMGEWMMRTPADPEPARVKRDLDKLPRASSSWDRAGR